MVLYVCPRCGYSANRKGNIRTHLLKKKPCDNIFNDTDRNFLLKNLNICNKEIDSQYTDIQQTTKQSAEYIRQSHLQTSQQSTTYTRPQKHPSKRKNKLPAITSSQENEKFLISQLAAKDAQIEKLIECVTKEKNKSTVTFNKKNTVHLHLNAHHATDFSHITDKDYYRIMNHAVGAIREFVCKAHFDPAVPQNNNIYISNLRNNHVMLFDGKNWNIQDRDSALELLIDRSEFTMEQKLEEWIESQKYYPDVMKRFQLYLDHKEEDEVRNNIKEQIKMVLYNKRPR